MFLCALLFSFSAQAGNLFPPEGSGEGTACPKGKTVLTWTGNSIKCTSVAEAFAIPTCTTGEGLTFDGAKFSCAKVGTATETDPAEKANNVPAGYCPMTSNISGTYQLASGVHLWVPRTLVKKYDNGYAVPSGVNISGVKCDVNGNGGMICNYGCVTGSWILLSYTTPANY